MIYMMPQKMYRVSLVYVLVEFKHHRNGIVNLKMYVMNSTVIQSFVCWNWQFIIFFITSSLYIMFADSG